jgi:hypothetical protein
MGRSKGEAVAVSARVVRAEALTVLEEEQDGKTFSRRVRYTLGSERRWATSLQKLRDQVHAAA